MKAAMLKRLVHFLLKALAVLLIVLLVIGLIVQIILWTDLPGKWVLSALSNRTGLAVSAERFRTGWTGTTNISGLTAQFALEDEPFVNAPALTLKHNSLLSLAVGTSFRLDHVRAEGAQLRILQDTNGRWNVQTLTELEDGGEQTRRPLNLPGIEADGLSIYVRDRQGRQTTINRVRIDAQSHGGYWAFQAAAPPSLAVKGRLAAARPYSHQVRFSLDGLDAFASTMIPAWLSEPQVDAEWNGYLSSERLTGTLWVKQAQLQQNRFAGKMTVQADPDAVSVRIDEVSVQPAGSTDFALRVAGGQLRCEFKERQAFVRDLTVQAGPVVISGGACFDMQTAQIVTEGRWTGSAPDGAPSEGTWSGSAHVADPGLKTVVFELGGHYLHAGSRLHARAVLNGSGIQWEQSHWTVDLSQLGYQSGQAKMDLGPGQVKVRVDWPRVELEQVTLANVRSLVSSGFYAADSRTWGIDVQAEGIRPVGGTEQTEPVDLTLRGQGNHQQAVLSQASVRRGDFQANAQATFKLPGGAIQNGTLNLSGRLPAYAEDAFLSRFSQNAWTFQTTLQGTVRPLNLSLAGQMQLEIPPTKVIADNALSVPFQIRADGSDLILETASYISEHGSWDFNGYYHLADRNGRLFVDLNTIPLELLSEVFGGWTYEGTLSGQLTADFPTPELSQLDLNGSWSVRDFKAESFAAETVQGDIHMKSGLAQLRNILAQQGRGRLEGQGQINLNASRQASFEFKAADWVYPADASPVSLTADADLTVDVDLRANRVVGHGQMTGAIDVLQQRAGTVKLKAGLDDRVFSITDIGGHLLGGALSGSLRIPLQNWMDSRADVQFADLQLDRLPDWQERIRGIGGRLSGQLIVRETGEARPLEPLSIGLYTQMQNGHFKEAQIGDFRLSAYAGPQRVLVTEAVLGLFSGTVQAQARWTMRDRAYLHLKTSFSHIDVNQVFKAVNPDANPIEGTIDGSATLLSTSDLKGLSGRIEGRLSNSNLINNTIIGSIYKSLVLGAQPSKPQGRGTITLHPMGARLEIDSFYYFNEGIEVRGSGVIEDIEKGLDSPVSGLVFGTTRPLGSIDLPGVKELDDLMGVLLLGSAAVRVSGTLGNVQTEVVPVPEVTDSIRSLIWSQRRQGQ